MSDATLLLRVEAQKKSGWVAALLNLFLPGAGYIYCGRWILGFIAFVFTVFVAIMTLGVGWFPMALLLIIDGFLCAGRYNKRLITKVLAEGEAKAAMLSRS